MKVLKIVFSVLLILIVLAVTAGLYMKVTLSPSYKGERKLTGLNGNVEVFYSAYGIPHVYASNETDAYYAFGYVHAQDRLWQMDLLRHVGSGRLAELFGEDLIETDQYLRTMGISVYAEKSANEYLQSNHESIPLVEAYLKGINDFIANNPKPLEHLILGLEVAPFEVKNIFETLGYMSFSFQNAQMTDPFLTELSAKLDSTYLKDLMVFHYPEETVIKNHDSKYTSLMNQAVSALSNLHVPAFIGSNSWVLSGTKTQSGKVILANDPHIGFAQPAVWYEAHLNMPDNEYYGYHIAGVPFPLLLHNERFANGLTMFENDDMDFYVEEIHPEDSNLYRYQNEWMPIQNREEEILVKDADPVKVIVRSTQHGPIVSDILQDVPLDEVVSMYWVMEHHPNRTLELISEFTRAKNIRDIEYAGSLIHSPGLNLMYGDSAGNVAWWASAKLIKRNNERTSKTFYDGANPSNEPSEFYAFSENPHAINPPWGYVYSANNQPDTVNGIIYSGYYLPDDRAERITEMIAEQETFSVEEMKQMSQDDVSKMFYAIKGILLHSIKDTKESQLLTALIEWDCSFNQNDFRPTIFQKWIYEIMEAAMKDEMGDDLWSLYQNTHTYKVAIEHLVKNGTSKWWDNVTTASIETRAEIIRQAFETTLFDLRSDWGDDYSKWLWKNVHQVTHNHALGTALNFLNVGPFPSSGGNEVINNMGYTYTGEKSQPILFGPSTRRIIDFSDVRNNSWSILPTGQSGNYFSPYYDDQAQMFVQGEFRKMTMNHGEIKQSENKMVLIPNK